jgi:hypothetical protein
VAALNEFKCETLCEEMPPEPELKWLQWLQWASVFQHSQRRCIELRAPKSKMVVTNREEGATGAPHI